MQQSHLRSSPRPTLTVPTLEASTQERVGQVFSDASFKLSSYLNSPRQASRDRNTVLEADRDPQLREFFEHLHRGLRIKDEVPLEVLFIDRSSGLLGLKRYDFLIRAENQYLASGEMRKYLSHFQITLHRDSPVFDPEQRERLKGYVMTDGQISTLNRNERIASLNLPDSKFVASIDSYLDDKGLAHLGCVYDNLREREARKNQGQNLEELYSFQGLSDERKSSERETRRSDASATISRFLVAHGMSPGEQEITQAIDSVLRIRRQWSEFPVMQGRRVVVGAGDEIRLDLFPELSGSDKGSGAFRFAQPRLLSEIQGQAPDSLTLLRASPSRQRQLHGLLQSSPETLQLFEDSRKNLGTEKIEEQRAFVREMCSILGINPEGIRCRTRRDSEHLLFQLGKPGSDEPVFSARMRTRERFGKEGKFDIVSIQEIVAPKGLEKSGVVDPHSVRRSLLASIESTPPGQKGFAFIFDGHGSPDGIYLTGSSSGGTVKVSPGDLAAAILKRSEKFGDRSRGDLYLIESCYSHDFLRNVAKILEPTGNKSILLSLSEHGQVGLSHGYSSTPMMNILAEAKKMQLRGEVFKIGDLIRVLGEGQSSRLFDTNPTLFLPEGGAERPGVKTPTRYLPISSVLQRGEQKDTEQEPA